MYATLLLFAQRANNLPSRVSRTFSLKCLGCNTRILDIPFNSIRKYTKISRWGRANFENLRLDRPKFVHEDVTIGSKGGSLLATWPETLRNCSSQVHG